MDQAVASAEARITRGANWFYWIAGLSLVNSLGSIGEAKWSFPLGLGITQVVDGVAAGFQSRAATVVGFCLDLFAAILVVLVGYLARRYRWAYLLGMVAYGLDGLINLAFSDWIGLAFHAFALVSMLPGVKAFKERAALAPQPEATGAPIQPSAL
jgi:hypothetical protein